MCLPGMGNINFAALWDYSLAEIFNKCWLEMDIQCWCWMERSAGEAHQQEEGKLWKDICTLLAIKYYKKQKKNYEKTFTKHPF